MSQMSISGLASGLDTSTIISQLMQVEAIPQQQLQAKLATEQRVVSAYQSVNTRITALQTAADALTLSSGWGLAKATSSASSVTATASTGALAGQLTFHVDALATNQVDLGSTSTALTDTTYFTGTSFTLTTGTASATPTTTTITPKDGSLQSIVTAVNAAGIGVTASAVQVSPGSYRLQLTSSKVGSAGAFSVDSALSSAAGFAATPLQAAADAQISLADGTAITSTTNTFSGVLPGVTFTVSEAGIDTTISVSPDEDALATKMKAIVDAANAAIDEIGKQANYDATGKTSGPLAGDSTVRDVQQRILGVVSRVAGNVTLSTCGVELTKDGHLTFDKDAFVKAYEADPAATQSTLAASFAAPMSGVAKAASDSATGTVTLAIQGANKTVKDLNDSISDWDRRLSDKQDALQRQFSALEVALAQMQSQQSWLAGQIGGLPSYSK